MEEIATFCILFLVYFLGILAIVQLSIRPVRKLVTGNSGNGKHWQTNYLRIILLSFSLSLVTTTIAFLLFP
ncbi:hypothetical protein DFQ04_3604 [Algoriphagus boseongensis]|uniref:Uncharacterized protein n=1 Tax=Algoriphagus boseongensis TaxID=1442587 RepID=A0A4R6T0T4_9BACT|nr:hypothetical protein [Algoriphagus boseongensis]TDQ13569.1 hypothetical protein DFQ04_3604 [Algoriphagus boseongensis]